MSAIQGFERVATRLRNTWGITVKVVPGWETRGAGTLTPKGFVRHHTAGSWAGGTYASLRICTYGREGLRNALCNWYQPREDAGRELWIVAAGTAWHAGSGGWQGLRGNSSVVGLEAENDGRGEPWGPNQIYSAKALDAELAREFGWEPTYGCEHKEWAPSRKIDRWGISGSAWRADVARILNGDDDMLKRGDQGPRVLAWQHRLNAWAGMSLKLDGDFGEKTEEATKAFQKRLGGEPDGRVTEIDTMLLLQEAIDRALERHVENHPNGVDSLLYTRVVDDLADLYRAFEVHTHGAPVSS